MYLRVAFQKANDSDRHVLKNLYSLYLHDLSRFTVNIQLGADGHNRWRLILRNDFRIVCSCFSRNQ